MSNKLAIMRFPRFNKEVFIPVEPTSSAFDLGAIQLIDQRCVVKKPIDSDQKLHHCPDHFVLVRWS